MRCSRAIKNLHVRYKVLFLVTGIFCSIFLSKFRQGTPEKNEGFSYSNISIGNSPCQHHVRSVASACERLHVDPSGSALRETSGSIYFRKRDGATNFKMFSIGAKNLLKHCGSDDLNFLCGKESHIALIKNFVKVPHLLFVAKPGMDIVISGNALVNQVPWDKHLTALLYLIMEHSHVCNVVDVGGNIGNVITMPALSIGCKVATFELQSFLKNMIFESAVVNGYRERLSLHGPIASKPHEVCFSPNVKHFAWIQSSGQENPQFRDKYRAHIKYDQRECHQTVRLDEVLEKMQFRKIQLLKLDVDGPELDVLNSLGKWLHNKSIMNFFIEIDIKDDKDKPIFDLLRLNGYSCMQLCRFNSGPIEEYQSIIGSMRAQFLKKEGLFVPECDLTQDVWCWQTDSILEV